MNILSKLLGKKGRAQIVDSDFGTLTFEGSLWTSKPQNSVTPFMIIVEAPATGPSEKQKEHFRTIISKFGQYEISARDFITSQSNVNRPLHVYSLIIPPDAEINRGQFVIELTNDDDSPIYRSEFINWQPNTYGEDD
jgi:hypothetical protein